MVAPYKNIIGLIKIIPHYILICGYQLFSKSDSFKRTEGKAIVYVVRHVYQYLGIICEVKVSSIRHELIRCIQIPEFGSIIPAVPNVVFDVER